MANVNTTYPGGGLNTTVSGQNQPLDIYRLLALASMSRPQQQPQAQPQRTMQPQATPPPQATPQEAVWYKQVGTGFNQTPGMQRVAAGTPGAVFGGYFDAQGGGDGGRGGGGGGAVDRQSRAGIYDDDIESNAQKQARAAATASGYQVDVPGHGIDLLR